MDLVTSRFVVAVIRNRSGASDSVKSERRRGVEIEGNGDLRGNSVTVFK